MSGRSNYLMSQVSKTVDTLLPLASTEFRYALIRCLRDVRTMVNTTPNPIDNLMFNLILDVLDLDINQTIPES